MTPACLAMLESLERTYGRPMPEDECWQRLCDMTLDRARELYRNGFRGAAIPREAANYMWDVYWENRVKVPSRPMLPDNEVKVAPFHSHAKAQVADHFHPACVAMIAAEQQAKAQQRSAA